MIISVTARNVLACERAAQQATHEQAASANLRVAKQRHICQQRVHPHFHYLLSQLTILYDIWASSSTSDMCWQLLRGACTG